MMPSRNNAAAKIATAGMMAALSMIFSWVEAVLPFQPGLPGVRLGLANFVAVICLYRLNAKYAFFCNIVRVLLTGFLFSGVFAMLYSLAGSMLSLLVMILLKKTGKFSEIGVSMAGGAAHNIGQLLVAMIAVSSLNLGYYLPVLLFSGTAAGIIVGIGAYVVGGRLPEKLFAAAEGGGK